MIMSDALLVESERYRKLWSSVILNAFSELKLRTNSSDDISPQALRAQAFSWINNKSTYSRHFNPETRKFERFEYKTGEECGLEWLCDHLDLSAEWLRRMSMTREGIQRVLNGHNRTQARHKVKDEEDEE
jgi:hypothetical protein